MALPQDRHDLVRVPEGVSEKEQGTGGRQKSHSNGRRLNQWVPVIGCITGLTEMVLKPDRVIVAGNHADTMDGAINQKVPGEAMPGSNGNKDGENRNGNGVRRGPRTHLADQGLGERRAARPADPSCGSGPWRAAKKPCPASSLKA